MILIRPEVKMYAAFARLNYRPWYALAEDPGPHHVLAFELLFFLSWNVFCRLHNASLTPNVSLSGDPLGT
jgi:hypothetical protein